MHKPFPPAVPEIPVTDMNAALDYYRACLGFTVDWGDGDSGISGVSRGHCRLFLTDSSFRAEQRNSSPVVIWLNCESNDEVDAQHAEWKLRGVTITSAPESKPWKLYEFTAADEDANVFRVFYDFSRDV